MIGDLNRTELPKRGHLLRIDPRRTVQTRHHDHRNRLFHTHPAFTLNALHSRLSAIFIDFRPFLPMLQRIEGLILESPRNALDPALLTRRLQAYGLNR